MKQRPAGRASSSEKIIRDIRRKTRKQYSAEEKIRIVLDGLRGEDSIAELIAMATYSRLIKLRACFAHTPDLPGSCAGSSRLQHPVCVYLVPNP